MFSDFDTFGVTWKFENKLVGKLSLLTNANCEIFESFFILCDLVLRTHGSE